MTLPGWLESYRRHREDCSTPMPIHHALDMLCSLCDGKPDADFLCWLVGWHGTWQCFQPERNCSSCPHASLVGTPVTDDTRPSEKEKP